MVTEVDFRNRPADEYREGLFDALTDAETGDELEIVADQDIDTHLIRYQIEHGRTLDWEYEHPDEEPRRLRVVKANQLDDGDLGTIDVRDLKPQRRHEALLQTFNQLAPNEGFILVNDHDPKPLYHELHSMHGDVIEWEYRSRGTDGWRVAIIKTDQSKADREDVVTRYDVRDIPKQERHPTIHHRYGMIPEGGAMELIAPHEPRPLRQEFQQQYGDLFTWEIVENEPGRCCVRITKGQSTAENTEQADDEDSDSDVTTAKPDDEELEVTDELDVRDLPPARRHELIFEAYANLQTGKAFVLVNDHDPKPLYHQFEAEAGDEFRWEYRQQDPGEFRVLIGKSDVTDAEATRSENPDTPF